ncbi:hypothetical protein AQUSIP_01900 [Aquicella siphonis]|uniref:Cupin 2 conserved barrel domain-containing protein n=1 Tax=Aquicella siphonis TaxID=254247 RepID=A0A5E4PF11_9COXI|nr:hypothetical protein [Aquicella siphonis]VVC74916.1 hypothetical protein AQUSIP_01900 [Aquicella siphonis]
MRKTCLALSTLFCYFLTTTCQAEPATRRIPRLANDKVSVWETIIYPERNQTLKLHRHERDRILVALSGGILKVTTDRNQSHELRLKKDMVYYLPRDVPGELHSDENISGHPVRVVVIELK